MFLEISHYDARASTVISCVLVHKGLSETNENVHCQRKRLLVKIVGDRSFFCFQFLETSILGSLVTTASWRRVYTRPGSYYELPEVSIRDSLKKFRRFFFCRQLNVLVLKVFRVDFRCLKVPVIKSTMDQNNVSLCFPSSESLEGQSVCPSVVRSRESKIDINCFSSDLRT